MRTRLASQEGQTATEYMLIISVVVIAIVAAAYAFVPTFRDGVNDLAIDVRSILRTGQIGGVGTPRNYNTASNNARRCVDQQNDPRYAAMFDPPKCLEDPVLVPAPKTAPASLAQKPVVLPRRPGIRFEAPSGDPRAPSPHCPASPTYSFVAVLATRSPERRARRRRRSRCA